MKTLTPAQHRALAVIRRDHATEPFSRPYDPETGRDVSGATLRRLHELGLIEHVRTNEVTYHVRGRFGRGNHYKRTKYENVWRLK
jgi:hypothetical protein